MDTIQTARKTTSQATQIIYLGISYGETLVTAMKKFWGVLREMADKQNRTIEEIYKAHKGKMFYDEGKFILYSKNNHKDHFSNLAVSREDLRQLTKLCKEYGIDFLYRKRPKNLEELYQKKLRNEPLTNNQEQLLQAFTYKDKEQHLILKDDIGVVAFAENDLHIMEKVLDRIEEHQYSIKQMKLQAEKIVNKAKQLKPQKKPITKSQER